MEFHEKLPNLQIKISLVERTKNGIRLNCLSHFF
jgi:hypothetical protein